MQKNSSSARRYCFTLNNPVSVLANFTEQPQSYVRFQLYQRERGDKGTEHFQGYLEFDRPVRLSHCKTLIPGAHFEVARGTAQQNYDYCTKAEGRVSEPIEYGVRNFQGKRNDISAAADVIKESLNSGDANSLATVASDFSVEYIKFHRGFAALEFQLSKAVSQSFRDVRCFFIHGPTGSGKTAFVRDTFGSDCYIPPGGATLWFDGYSGEGVLCLDEYSGGIERSAFLRLLDGHPLLCPVKGSHVYARWRYVFILSNDRVDLQWDDAVLRRFAAQRSRADPAVYGPYVERKRRHDGGGGGGGSDDDADAAVLGPNIFCFDGARGDYIWDAERRTIVARPVLAAAEEVVPAESV